MKTPLAWLNLTHNKQRLLTAICTIAFAVFLMFMQMGFRNALLDSNVQFIRALNADLILVSQRRYTSFIEQTFQRQRLYQVQGFTGVKAAFPLYIDTGIWQTQDGLSQRPIRVFGITPEQITFRLPEIQTRVSDLVLPNTILADRKSRSSYGPMTPGTITELSNRRVKIIDNFDLGTDFLADGNLVMTDQNFLRIFIGRPSGIEGNVRASLDEVDLGLVQLEANQLAQQIADQLNQVLPADVVVLTKAAFIDRDLAHWNQSTPIGFLFGLGTIIGLIVGIIVVYNILYTDIGDNLSQYATLKAMGYPNQFLQSVILQEALILVVLGYFPGLCASILFYETVAQGTGLLLQMTAGLMLLTFILTIVMCVASSLIAARKLKSANPAEIFGQNF